MGLVALAGLLLLGLGPALAFFALVLAPRPLLTLVAVSASAFWLLVLLAAALVARPFLQEGPAAYLLPLLAVAAQEAARPLLWSRLFAPGLGGLSRLAPSLGARPPKAEDELLLAASCGWGHAAAALALLYLSPLALAVGPATLYSAACPGVSLFLLAGAFVVHCASLYGCSPRCAGRARQLEG